MKTLLLFPLLRLLAFTAILSSVLAVEEAAPSLAGETPFLCAGASACRLELEKRALRSAPVPNAAKGARIFR